MLVCPQVAALGKKKKAKDDERINVLDNARKQHNYHIGRLEQMLRLLDNNDLAPDQVRLAFQFSEDACSWDSPGLLATDVVGCFVIYPTYARRTINN